MSKKSLENANKVSIGGMITSGVGMLASAAMVNVAQHLFHMNKDDVLHTAQILQDAAPVVGYSSIGLFLASTIGAVKSESALNWMNVQEKEHAQATARTASAATANTM